MCESEDTSKITFVCSDGKSVMVHKALLVHHSPYFKNYFASEWAKLRPDGKWTTRYNSNVVAAIGRYVYHKVDNREYDYSECVLIYTAAAEFEFYYFQQSVSSILASLLAVGNVKELLQLANVHSDTKLHNKCFNFIKKNAFCVLAEPLFATLSTEAPDLWRDIIWYVFESEDSSDDEY
jgi:predicted methyltransferase